MQMTRSLTRQFFTEKAIISGLIKKNTLDASPRYNCPKKVIVDCMN